MISAFCPGHVTCFFQPITSLDPLSAGSRGAGIRLSLGTTVKVNPVPGNVMVTKVNDGTGSDDIIRKVVRSIDPSGGYEINVRHDLPVGQGFGMSAADAVAVAICMCQITGRSKTEAYRIAHVADLLGGGGRGDVAGIMANCQQPVRTVAGIPPFGKVEDFRVNVGRVTLAVLGSPLETKDVLSEREKYVDIRNAGSDAMQEYLERPSLESLFKISNRFSAEAGVRSRETDAAIEALEEKGFMAAMCMLGNSIFTNAPVSEARSVIGDVWAVSCNAVPEEAGIIRTR
jgi:pantoate kinase